MSRERKYHDRATAHLAQLDAATQRYVVVVASPKGGEPNLEAPDGKEAVHKVDAVLRGVEEVHIKEGSVRELGHVADIEGAVCRTDAREKMVNGDAAAPLAIARPLTLESLLGAFF